MRSGDRPVYPWRGEDCSRSTVTVINRTTVWALTRCVRTDRSLCLAGFLAAWKTSRSVSPAPAGAACRSVLMRPSACVLSSVAYYIDPPLQIGEENKTFSHRELIRCEYQLRSSLVRRAVCTLCRALPLANRGRNLSLTISSAQSSPHK